MVLLNDQNDLHALGNQVDDAVTELLTLWPQLAHALQRDQGAPPPDEARVTTSASIHSASPVNEEVLAAITMLNESVWPACWLARKHLAEPAQSSTVEDSLASAGILYRRLVGRQKTREAKQLAREVFHWHRTARRAIGLTRRTHALRGATGEIHCPLHDDPLTTLRLRGDEGTMHDRRAIERITWRNGDGLYCPDPACDGKWGASEYPFLGRLVAAAQARRINGRMMSA